MVTELDTILIQKGTIFNFNCCPVEMIADTLFYIDPSYVSKLLKQGYKLKKEFYYWELY